MQQQIIEFATRFAICGYYVFPLYDSKSGPKKPFGWARNKLTDNDEIAKSIPATNDPSVVAKWPEEVSEKYNGAEIVAYGVLGLGRIIFDLDLKNGKDGLSEFTQLKTQYSMNHCEFVVKSKSGGFHLYYAKPDQFKNLGIKSSSSISIGGQKYPGLDVRGDGGMVIGPTVEGPESEWCEGNYQIIKGGPETVLSRVPVSVCLALSRSAIGGDSSDLVRPIIQDSSNELEILKRGEIPEKLSNGNRNNGFYIFLNALRNKGFSSESAKKYVGELIKVTEDSHTLHESVDIDDMISRIWRVDSNNPYDVCRDLLELGLYRLTAYRSKLMYVILNDNPYIDSKSPHDIASMRQLMARYARKMANADGKTKVVNPADLIDGLLTSDREVASFGYKPGAGEVFSLTEMAGGRRFLNTWSDPRQALNRLKSVDNTLWDKYKLLVSRIFGPEGSDEYQLGLDFPAWIIQRPGVKPVIAPFIMSRVRGAGKSLYLSLLSQILGYSKSGNLQARQFKVEQIGSRFFDPSECSTLIFDEVQFPVHREMRKESTAFWKHLKTLVTQDIMSVEYKGGDTVQVASYAAIVLAGNTGNHFPVEEFDRRIWIIDNDPPELNPGVMDEFFDLSKIDTPRETKQLILGSLLHHLSDHKIKLPLDVMRAPMNDAKREMYLNTLSDLEEWWITYFEDKTNLMARTPVLTKSAVMFILQSSDRLASSKWREDLESTFRELKRRGMLQAIRSVGNQQSRILRSVPILTQDGAIIQDLDGRDALFTSREHGSLNSESNDVIMQMFLANVNQVQSWKKEKLSRLSSKILSSTN